MSQRACFAGVAFHCRHRLRIARIASAACLILSAYASPAPQTPQALPATEAPPRTIGWIRAHAIPLATVSAGREFEELAPLRALIGEARVVALGEPTHGSREVFQLKHRLIEYLATELGFNVFAIEANQPEAHRVDDYVSHGDGNPSDLIRGMKFWTWSTEEVRALVVGLHDFNFAPANRAAGRHVEFTGFDLQDPFLASALVRDYVATHDPELLPAVERATAALRPSTPAPGDFTPPPLQSWRAIEARLADSAAKISDPADLAAARWIAQCARIVVQALALEATPPTPRDESMARNVAWLLAQNPRAKIILWAHNQHVKRAPEAMGGWLSQHLGRELVVIGFATGRGSYRARAQRDRALGSFPLQPPPADSIESALAATQLPIFLLDLRPARHAEDARWLLANRPFRTIGSLEMTGQFQPALLGNDYDVLAWVEETSAAVPLPGGWPPSTH